MCSRFPSLALFSALLVLPSMAEARELRVCADPNNLPYSKSDGSGFENKIAAVLADELKADLVYTWMPQWRGFLRKTLKTGACDVVMGHPPDYQVLRSTRPYYRSSYAFVQRSDAAPIRSFEDPALRTLKVGVQLVGDDGANTPPVQVLAKRGIVKNVRGYLVYGDHRTPAPLSPIMKAVADGEVDVAIVWGPIAGYFATREGAPLSVTPVLLDPSMLTQPMTFDIAVGVRKSDVGLANEIDRALDRRRAEIDSILAAYGVPRSDQATTIGQVR